MQKRCRKPDILQARAEWKKSPWWAPYFQRPWQAAFTSFAGPASQCFKREASHRSFTAIKWSGNREVLSGESYSCVCSSKNKLLLVPCSQEQRGSGLTPRMPAWPGHPVRLAARWCQMLGECPRCEVFFTWITFLLRSSSQFCWSGLKSQMSTPNRNSNLKSKKNK